MIQLSLRKGQANMFGKVLPASVNPSVMNWIITGLMAVTFIVLLKWALAKWPVAGLSEVVNMV